MTYTCAKCSKAFVKKTDYDRHLNRKISCDNKTMNEIIEAKVEEIIEAKIEARVEAKIEEIIERKTPNSSTVILNLVAQLHDLMRTKAAITGQKAYYDIIRLLLLRFMEPMIKPNAKLEHFLNPDNYKGIHDFKDDYIKYLNFETLVKSFDADFDDKLYLVWGMLSMNDFTKAIFPKNKTFNSPPIVLEIACQKIYNTLKDVHFDELTEDIGGSIYEHFVNKKGGGGGQSLGQFFTPRKLINLTMEMNKEIFPDNKPKNIYDPCAGTGGFLMEMYKAARINPDEIYGGELEPDTFANGLMNMMLTTGSICNLKNCDSFQDNLAKKYDWIGTNPPFGIKGLKYEEILSRVNCKTECIAAKNMYPIKTNDGSALFLQHCIAKLAIGGMCNIVLPAGQLLTGKSGFTKIRQHLIQKCILQAVLAVPGGVFDCAGVATVVLFFGKSSKYCTGDVDFYETDDDCQTYHKVSSVSLKELAANQYILDYKYYRVVQAIQPIDATTEMKTIGEVCEFIQDKKHNVSDGSDEGLYELLCSSTKGKVKYLDTYDYEGPFVAIGTGGSANVHFKSKFNVSTDFKVFKTVDSVDIKYLYIILQSKLNDINNMFHGATLKHLNFDSFKSLKILVPSLKKQQEIVSHCEVFDKKIQSIQSLINSTESNKEIIYELYISSTDTEIKTISDVCEFIQDKKHTVSDGSNEGLYELLCSSTKGKVRYLDTYDYEGPFVALGTGGSANVHFKSKFNVSTDFKVCKTNDSVNIKYLYIILQSKLNDINNMFSGATIKHLNFDSFKSFKIPVPSIELQEEIIKRYDLINQVIETYTICINKLEDNKKQYIESLFN